MRRTRHLITTITALVALMALTTATALAGNYAEVAMIDADGAPLVAGEEREIRFDLLQHGVTPVDYGTVQLTLSLAGRAEPIVVDAVSLGGGEWSASVTFPVEGDWQMRITHSALETPPARSIAVGPSAASAWIPGTATVAAFAAAALLLIVGTRLLDRSRRGPGAEPATTLVRAG